MAYQRVIGTGNTLTPSTASAVVSNETRVTIPLDDEVPEVTLEDDLGVLHCEQTTLASGAETEAHL